ncbi:hypothetical protein GCM10010182_22930 [Actinomadura cremea]|nr:hypothetical protein GCM10010182_22930 [Actinomadura cremea]
MPGGRATGSTGPTGSAGSTGLRATVERLSAGPVVLLHRLPRWVLLAAVFALLVLGMAATGWPSAAGLFALALFLAWFAYLNWPALDASGRLLRVVAVTVLAGFGVARIIGRF